MLRPWHFNRTYSCRNHFFGLHFLATQWRFECLGGQFGVWCGAAVGSRLGMPSCDHEALMLEHWPSKRPHFTTERVECCDHGLYVVCAVAGIIFCCSSFFLAGNGHRKNPAAENELLRFGVWQIGFRDF